MKFKQIFTLVILGFLLIFNFYLVGVIWVLQFLLTISLYLLVFYSISILWRKTFNRKIIDFYKFTTNFLYSLSWVFFILFLFLWSFVFYYNEINRASMNEYTLTNWEKIVKFQSMVHIGREEYYKEIINNLILFKENKGVYFFEGVKSWTKENMEKFNNALWMEFDNNLYENMSKLFWLTYQDSSKFLWLVNDLDFNVDIWIDDIISLYDTKNTSLSIPKTYNVPIDANKLVNELLIILNEKQLKLIAYTYQAILNFFIWNEAILESATNTYANKELFEVIIDERNKILADAVLNSEYDKIFITYWALHFKWFYNLLLQEDKDWKIIEIKALYPISN